MLLGTEVSLSPDNIVLDGDPAPPPRKKVTAPNFRPMYIVAKRLHVRLPLGTEEGLSLGAQPPNFGQCPLWPNGWMD